MLDDPASGAPLDGTEASAILAPGEDCVAAEQKTSNPDGALAPLIARVAAAALAALCAFGALFVFEAASKTGLASVAANAASRTPDPRQRTALLSDARDLIETSWARPAQWHAGAVEARSWIYALEARAARRDPSLAAQSAAAAALGVSLAPIQPTAWARLAAFAAAGRSTPACDAATCLERSWLSARMTDAATSCARLQLANRIAPIAASDPRVQWFVRSRFHPRVIARCLDFLPTRNVIHILVERDRQIRQERARGGVDSR